MPAASAPGTYTDFKYTTSGSPLSLKSPAVKGNYEIWYASDRVKNTVFKSIAIVVN